MPFFCISDPVSVKLSWGNSPSSIIFMIEFGQSPGGTYAPDTQMFTGLSCPHAAHRDEFLPLTRLEPSGSAASNRLAFVLTPRSEVPCPFQVEVHCSTKHRRRPSHLLFTHITRSHRPSSTVLRMESKRIKLAPSVIL